MKPGWIPPRSPYSLIQEDLWSAKSESEWHILVAAVMLNCTTRKQVDRVLPSFLQQWPTPRQFVHASPDDVALLIRPLGFANRRTANLLKMTHHYLAGPWSDARELPGIGEYGARSHEIFCLGILGDEAPKDGALGRYWAWVSVAANVSAVEVVVDHVVADEEARVGNLANPRSDADQLTVAVVGSAA